MCTRETFFVFSVASNVLEFVLYLWFIVLDLYADTPPLETLMEVPLHMRRKQLFNVRPYCSSC